MKGILAAVLLGLAVSCQAFAQVKPAAPLESVATAAFRRYLERFNVQWVEASKSGDAEAIAAFYTPDASLLPPGEKPARGRPAILAYFAWMRKVKITDVVITVEEFEVFGNTAYVMGTVTDTLGGPNPGIISIKYIDIRKQQPDGSWLVFRDIWNDLPKNLSVGRTTPLPAPKPGT
jgi:uncharacterized protein (TIGR02246 family)